MPATSRSHVAIDPAILYSGTPVVLVGSLNPGGSPNLAPISSAWWLGRSCLLGFGARSQTPQNIQRTVECVLDLPSVGEAEADVDEGVRLTGHDDRIDPGRWRPLIMSFQQLYGLGGRARPSRLAEIPESAYRPKPVAEGRRP